VISCRRVADLLDYYAANELSSSDCQRLEWHLHRCPLCADEVESYLKIIRLVRGLPPATIPPTMWERLRQFIEQVKYQADPATSDCQTPAR
jgi:RNA polymerase sigma-70 factor (ECF subfamily)